MATMSLDYSANTGITLELSSLGTSSTFLAGVESDEIDNTTNKYLDALVTVDGITAHASTATTAGQMIVVYAWGSDTSLATTPIDTLDGTSSTETLSHAAVLNALRYAGSATVVTTTAGLVYYIQPFSIASLFGGVMPKYWGLFVAHNHTGSLGASNNNLFSFNGIKYTSA